MKKLLLHVCCAPCSIVPLEQAVVEGHTVAAAYVNPNIHPLDEYEHRRDTFASYAANQGIPVIEGSYNPSLWDTALGVLGGPYPLIEGDPSYEGNLACRRKRCEACYRLRFDEVARLAAAQGFDAIGTTLTISPYQFTALINKELARAAAQQGLEALQSDLSASYPDATRRSRALGMYRQNYCGCHFSQQEAALERAARKAARHKDRVQAQSEGPSC